MSTARLALLAAMAAAGAAVAALLFLASPPRTLHEAAAFGTAEEVRALLAQGADVEALDASGDTPLRVAAREGNFVAMREILIGHARVDAVDAHGMTALHTAAAAGRAVTAEMLLGVHADWTRRDDRGRTPLDLALASGDADTIRTLRWAQRPRAPIPGAPPVQRGVGRAFPPSSIEWRREADGSSTWEVWGERAGGEHEALRLLPAGYARPRHSHGSDLREILLSGNLEEAMSDRTARIWPGDTVLVLASASHALRCVGPEPCLVVEHQLGPADEKPPRDGTHASVIHGMDAAQQAMVRRSASSNLWSDDTSQERGLVVLYAPGFQARPHRHGMGEDVFVMRGELDIQAEGIPGSVPAGGFERIPPATTMRPRCVSSDPCYFYIARWGPLTTTMTDSSGELTASPARDP